MASRFARFRARAWGAGSASSGGGGGGGSSTGGGGAWMSEVGERAAYFIKAVAAIYLVRENLVEFTVVSCACPAGVRGGWMGVMAGTLLFVYQTSQRCRCCSP